MEQTNQTIAEMPVKNPVEIVPGTIIVPGWMSTEDFFRTQYEFLTKMRDDRLDRADEFEDSVLGMSYRMAASDVEFAAEIVKKLGQSVGIDVTHKK